MQLEKLKIGSLPNTTIILADAGAYKNLKTKVEDCFRFSRHHNIQVIHLACYAEDILTALRENCLKLYTTIVDPYNFFEFLIKTYSIEDEQSESGILQKIQQYRDQLDYGIIEFDTRSQKYKILNHKYR